MYSSSSSLFLRKWRWILTTPESWHFKRTDCSGNEGKDDYLGACFCALDIWNCEAWRARRLLLVLDNDFNRAAVGGGNVSTRGVGGGRAGRPLNFVSLSSRNLLSQSIRSEIFEIRKPSLTFEVMFERNCSELWRRAGRPARSAPPRFSIFEP